MKTPLKIAVNTRLLLKDQMEGIGRYTYELFSRISEAHPEYEFHFIFDRKVESHFEFSSNVKLHVVPPMVRHPFLAWIWFEITLKRKLLNIRPNLFISPDGMNALNQVCRTITVMHDINFVHHPEYFPILLRWYYLRRSPVIAHNSERVVTVSEYSAKDIAENYKIPKEKIKVIYNSVGLYFNPQSLSAQEETRNQFADGCAYFLFVGGMYHRKNLLNQFKAFEQFKSQRPSDLKMVYVGQVVKDAKPLLKEIESSEFKRDVIVLGRKEEDELRKLMGSAMALTYVSSIEGFGIPMVEAMMSGTPVITANNSSMPEICGDAALYADATDVDGIAQQMIHLYDHPEVRTSMSQKGVKQAEKFSWDRSAEEFWELIEQVISE